MDTTIPPAVRSLPPGIEPNAFPGGEVRMPDFRTVVEMLSDFLLNEVPQASELSRSLVFRFAKQTVSNAIVFAEKQHDYGAGNIAKFGERGVLVRVSDKVERLINLDGGTAPQNESVKDNWGDVANYGTIGQMTNAGEWPGCQEKHLLCRTTPPAAPGSKYESRDE